MNALVCPPEAKRNSKVEGWRLEAEERGFSALSFEPPAFSFYNEKPVGLKLLLLGEKAETGKTTIIQRLTTDKQIMQELFDIV